MAAAAYTFTVKSLRTGLVSAVAVATFANDCVAGAMSAIRHCLATICSDYYILRES